jgi:hypothetical protein
MAGSGAIPEHRAAEVRAQAGGCSITIARLRISPAVALTRSSAHKCPSALLPEHVKEKLLKFLKMKRTLRDVYKAALSDLLMQRPDLSESES